MSRLCLFPPTANGSRVVQPNLMILRDLWLRWSSIPPTVERQHLEFHDRFLLLFFRDGQRPYYIPLTLGG